MFAKVLLTGFAVAALALAQGGGMGSGGGMGGDPSSGGGMGGSGGKGGSGGGGMDSMGGGGGGARPQKESKADMMVNRLKLNKDQKSEFETILESTQKDAQPIIQQVFQARTNLANGLLTGKSDAEIAPLNQALADAQFQMTGVEVMAFRKIVGLLKPNQTAKAPEAFDLMADIFMPQPGGGGGGRGQRGGGR